ncbi:uncharacterized protein LOC128929037 [Callithrix jacchus]
MICEITSAAAGRERETPVNGETLRPREERVKLSTRGCPSLPTLEKRPYQEPQKSGNLFPQLYTLNEAAGASSSSGLGNHLHSPSALPIQPLAGTLSALYRRSDLPKFTQTLGPTPCLRSARTRNRLLLPPEVTAPTCKRF